MTHDPKQGPAAQHVSPGSTVTVTHLPTLHGSDVAPIISFDEVPYFGNLYGIGRLTLAAQVLSSPGADGTVSVDHVVTVHLRGSLRSMAALRDTIDKLLLAATPIEGPQN
jgi:hypothetical protein